MVNGFRFAGDATHLAAMVALLAGIVCHRSARTLSLRSQELFVLVYLFRYLDVFDGPVKYHSKYAPEWLGAYNFAGKCLFVGLSVVLVAAVRVRSFAWGWEWKEDKRFWYLLLLPAIALGAGTTGEMSFREVCWTISIFLESMAILPQMAMIPKCEGLSGPVLCFLLAMGAYKTLYIVNWMLRVRFEAWYKPGIVHVAGVLQILFYVSGLCWAVAARARARRREIRYTQLPVISEHHLSGAFDDDDDDDL
eukprot:g5722.t1